MDLSSSQWGLRIIAWMLAAIAGEWVLSAIWNGLISAYYPQFISHAPTYVVVSVEGVVIGIWLIELGLQLIRDNIPFGRICWIWLIMAAFGTVLGILGWVLLRLAIALLNITPSLELLLLSPPITWVVGLTTVFLIIRFEEAPHYR